MSSSQTLDSFAGTAIRKSFSVNRVPRRPVRRDSCFPTLHFPATFPAGSAEWYIMGKMQKILLVEDDALIARIYRRKLEDAGFQVMVAGDGLSALKLLPEFMPELIVLDIMLPKLN